MRRWEGVPVTAAEDILGESPVWCEERGQLLWVDVRRALLRSLCPATGGVEAVHVDGGATGVVLDVHGVACVLARSRLLRLSAPGVIESTAWQFDLPDEHHRLNEAKCDQTGALWCGTMRDFGLTRTGSLLRIDAGGRPGTLRRDITVPNTLAFSPDGHWVYFADTRAGMIERARFDPQAGVCSDWQTFVAADAAPGRPDGVAIDTEGFLWNARFDGGCVARFRPDGTLDGTVALPVSRPTSCTFGGPSMETLYVTTARQGIDDAQLRREPLAGAVFACETGVRGHPAGRLADAIWQQPAPDFND